MSEIDDVTRKVLAAMRGSVYVEGLAAGLLDGDESDCWYVDELRRQWLAGFTQGRKLAAMAIENEALKKEKENLEEILRRRHEK